MPDHRVALDDIKASRAAFEANESRNLFYRAATELVDLALRGSTSLTMSEALAVLLQTWNRLYYQYRKFDAQHFAEIDALLAGHRDALAGYRKLAIETLAENEKSKVVHLFREFELVLGPVGAAKALHLLAPRFFPLWDRAIADAYELSLGEAGSNGDRYWGFMLTARDQCLDLRRHGDLGGNLLKLIDEYNYCKYTKEWPT